MNGMHKTLLSTAAPEETNIFPVMSEPGSLNAELYALNVAYLTLIRRFANEQKEDCMIRFGLSEDEVEGFAALTVDEIKTHASPFMFQLSLRRELSPLGPKNMRMFLASLNDRRRGSDRRKVDLPFVGEDRRQGDRRQSPPLPAGGEDE